MPQTIETTVYQFNELGDDAKERARDWWREASAGDNDFAEHVIEDFERVCGILGVELATDKRTPPGACVYWRGFSSQGDGASWEGRYSSRTHAPKRIREHAPKDEMLHRIADDLQDLQRHHRWRLVAKVTTSGTYCHSHTMSIVVWSEDDDGGSCVTGTEEALRDLLRGLADWLYRQLESAYEYEMSDEHINEAMKANEYTFTAEGRLFG